MSLSDLARKLERLATVLDSDKTVDGLLDKAQTRLQVATAAFRQPSGRTQRNLTTKSPVLRLGRGRFIGGLGDKSVMGDWDASAPKGTLRAFFDDHHEFKPNKWKYLSAFAKETLEKERLQGKYGGATAAAAGKSPYALMLDGTSAAQEASASRAGITPTRYIKTAFQAFSSQDVPQYVNQVIQEALSG